MCGIFGFWQFDDNLIDPSVVHQATTLLRHRGPDDEGYLLITPEGQPTLWGGDQTPEELHLPHISEATSPSVCLAFGHRRLSILDLSPSGHQPMSYGDGRFWITYNGEVYNYLEIRAELQAQGYTFHSETDTEVILAAYQCWGSEALTRFNGMFALAIWDAKTNTLFCARDRFGIKPFYYYFDHHRFVFSSEIKSILVSIPEAREVSYPILSNFLVYGALDTTPQTFFARVRSLSPAHYFFVRPDTREIQPQRYWDINPEDIREHYDYSRPEHTLLELLTDSIKLRLRSDVPVGTCLSGGLDSSSIVAITSSQLPHQVNTFSSVYADSAYSEEEYIKVVVEQCQTLAHYTSPSPNDFLEILPKIIWHLDEPAAGPGVYSQWFVMELASRSVKVLLDGQGGDELFAGYFSYLPLHLRSLFYRTLRDPRLFRRFVYDALVIVRDTHRYFFPHLTWRQFSNKVLSKVKGQHFKSGFLKPDIYLSRQQLSFSHHNPLAPNDILNHRLYRDITVTSIPALLHYEDRNGMAFGIEARVPLLDHRLVEFALVLPSEFKVNGSTTKYIIRHALKNILPEAIRTRRDKKGYPTPLSVWLRQSLLKQVDELLDYHFSHRDLYNLEVARQIWQQHKKGISDHSNQIFRWIAAEFWFQQFIDDFAMPDYSK